MTSNSAHLAMSAGVTEAARNVDSAGFAEADTS